MAAKPVSDHGVTHPPAEGEPHSDGARFGEVEKRDLKPVMADTDTFGAEPPEGPAFPNRVDQADSRVRPLARRDRMMARPPRVDMR